MIEVKAESMCRPDVGVSEACQDTMALSPSWAMVEFHSGSRV
jgi:hypothetical protein